MREERERQLDKIGFSEGERGENGQIILDPSKLEEQVMRFIPFRKVLPLAMSSKDAEGASLPEYGFARGSSLSPAKRPAIGGHGGSLPCTSLRISTLPVWPTPSFNWELGPPAAMTRCISWPPRRCCLGRLGSIGGCICNPFAPPPMLVFPSGPSSN
ncbi:ribosomal protein S5 domain 2-like superfamily protein [Striga asiatica]|uniref:Ribosomal protein S5 domain 2-like superfamily protein n=1 Tax=Striga asiatica TaxID=4170 RepID=A0A5A7RE78_STRAF|nr:ribosomal protein S5 domain 2-like superfamily protein [Striga asiatica]